MILFILALCGLIIGIYGNVQAQEVSISENVLVENLASTEDLPYSPAPIPVLIETSDGLTLITNW